jgi:hypothetical protein
MIQHNENMNKDASIKNDGFLSEDSILALGSVSENLDTTFGRSTIGTDDRNIEIGGSCKLQPSQDSNEDKQSAMRNAQLISLQCTNANTIRFRLPIFVSDVGLQQTAYTL